mgnify:CR=1 FL=1
MFSRQAPLIGESLFLSGMAPAQASAVQNLLGQCRAEIVHRGPVTLDYTKPDMRLITPDIAKHRYPNQSLPEPEKWPKEEEEEEDPDPPIGPPPTPFDPPDNYETNNWVNTVNNVNARYWAGSYIQIDEARRVIRLRNDDGRRHCVFPQVNLGAPNTVGSVRYAASSNAPQHVDLTVREQAAVTEWDLQVNAKQITVVTDITYNANTGTLSVKKERCWVFDPKPLATVPIVVGAGPNCGDEYGCMNLTCVDLTTLPYYDGSVTQILGHTDAECLQWYDVTACPPA